VRWLNREFLLQICRGEFEVLVVEAEQMMAWVEATFVATALLAVPDRGAAE